MRRVEGESRGKRSVKEGERRRSERVKWRVQEKESREGGGGRKDGIERWVIVERERKCKRWREWEKESRPEGGECTERGWEEGKREKG